MKRWFPVLMVGFSVAAQEPLPLETVPSDAGISLHLIYAVHQDRQGLMWFGTMHGLIRYDGVRYRVFRHDPSDSLSISHDDIVSIHESSDGYLWIGTYGGGINRLDPRTSAFLRFPNPHSDAFPAGTVWDIEGDVSGNLWLATDEGLYRLYLTGQRYRIARMGQLPVAPIHHVRVDQDGSIWCAFAGLGLWRMHGERVTNDPLMLPDSTTKKYTVTNLLEDRRGRLWVGTRWGLCYWDSGNVYPVDSKRTEVRLPVSRLLQDRHGFFWVGTFGRGLFRFSEDLTSVHTFQSEGNPPSKLLNNAVLTLLEDRSGILWIGTYYGGLQKYSPGRFKFSAEPSLNGRHIFSTLLHADGSVWVGHQGGLDVMGGTSPPLVLNSNNPAVTALLQTRSGDVWIGTALSGLFRYRRDRLDHYQIGNPAVLTSNFISRLMEDKKGRIWIGTNGGGLYFVDHDVWRKDSLGLPNQSILSLIQDRYDRIWVGTYGGLSVRDSSGAFRTYRYRSDDSTSLSHSYVYSIAEDGRGRLWVGTANGLNRFDEAASSFRRWTESNGLPNPVISDIRVDENNRLWLMTHRGVILFDETRGFTRFDSDDGLPGNVFNPGSLSVATDGRIAAGSTQGLAIFYPDSIRLSSYEPTITITGVDIHGRNGRSPLYPESVQLEPNETSLTIQFASSDYTVPRRNRFEVRLDPSDTDWMPVDGMEMSYFYLSPGEYRFRVRGSNSDGKWAKEVDQLRIVIRPPFYRTWWFGSIACLCMIIAVWFIHRRRVQTAVRLESWRREEENRVRLRISQDFHDELGHDLTRINLFTELLRRSFHGASEQTAAYLNKVAEASSRLSLNARNLIWALDPQHDSLYDLVLHVQRFGEQLFEDSDIEFSVDGLSGEIEKIRMPMADRREIALVVKEALHNALRHSKAHHVTLSIRHRKSFFEMAVEDDGVGIQELATTSGNGLANMHVRTQRLKGELNVEAGNSHGTRVRLRVPLGETS